MLNIVRTKAADRLATFCYRVNMVITTLAHPRSIPGSRFINHFRSRFVLAAFALSLSIGIGCGFLSYTYDTHRFVNELSREANSLQALTGSYVEAYAEVIGQMSEATDVVPAQFRAIAQQHFNKSHANLNDLSASMVGIKGREIGTAPSDYKLAVQLASMAANNTGYYEAESAVTRLATGRTLRSVFPSIATSQSCADCHNVLQNNRYDWQVGDMMGAYVIDRNVESAFANYRRQAGILGTLTAVLVLLGATAWRQFQILKRQSAALDELASTDSLTGCYNRRYLLNETRNRHDNGGIKGGLITFDIDFFKQVNDKYGHDFGDQVLIRVAEITKGAIRGQDVLARVGGEEFVVYLPGCSEEDSLRAAYRIRDTLARTEHHYKGMSKIVTVSVGVVQMLDTREYLFFDWLNAADKLLYAAKHAGRNCVKYSERAFNAKKLSMNALAAS